MYNMYWTFGYLYYTYVLHGDNDGFKANMITAAVDCRRLRYIGSGNFR